MRPGSKHELSAEETARLHTDGFVVRHDVFSADEIGAMATAAEELVASALDGTRRRRFAAGAYTFEPDSVRGLSIKWEGDSDVVHGIEPCAHLSPELARWAHDERFVAPMRAVTGHTEPMLFTEKLNLKRPHHGGVNPLHQDYPYWIDVTPVAAQVGTAMVYLDDASVANGCLEVVPGSHRGGAGVRRTDRDAFGNFELDPASYASAKTAPVEGRAGTVIYFGAFLVHKSEPNRSALPRRAMLYSYQPPGYTTLLDNLRLAAERRRQERAARAGN